MLAAPCFIADDIFDEAVIGAVEGVDVDRGFAADRNVDRAMNVALVERAIGGENIAAEFAEFGLFGRDVDDARRGVLAKLGALRSLQHFDPFQIAKAVDRATEADDDIIDHQADRRFGRAGEAAERADAANAEASVVGGGAELHARKGVGDVGEVLEAGRGKLVTAKSRHGEWDVLQAFGAPGGGDDDVRRGDGLGRLRRGCFLRPCRRRDGEQAGAAQGYVRGELSHDVDPLPLLITVRR